ncbi:MAG: DUF58 domain-containing protein [Bacteroidales bacterium]|nr:DUF58 domain-containing protein [Bacteroidales bacterium]
MKHSIDQNRLEQFGSLEFLARQVVEGFITGLHKSPYHGFSVEFAEHRLYNPGESTRHIDWKLYGKTDKMFVKRYEEETNLRCQLVIDASSSMYYPLKNNPTLDDPNKLTFSVYAAAAIMHLMKKQRDAVGLSIFSNQIDENTIARTTSLHHKHLYSKLEEILQSDPLKEAKSTSAAESLHTIAEVLHKRSLVILFSDMFENDADIEAVFSALQHLKHNKHEVILFHVTDRLMEEEFDFDNRPYRFVDMESGEQIKLRPGEIKDQYIRQMKAFKKELKLRCAQYRIDFIEADINKGFEQVLMPYLLKRNKLY